MKKIFLIATLFLCFSCGNKPEIYEEFYSDGMIKSETEIVNGLRNGISKTYDERGRLTSTAEFVNDKYDGWMTTYNPLNGKITAKALYKNDKQNGPVTLYYAEGQLYREEFYKDGRLDSIVKTYWPDGSLQAEVWFRKGSPGTGLKEYDQKGKLIEQPQIIIEEHDQLSLLNTYKLKIYLSDHSTNVDFYTGDLLDGKYLDKEAVKIRDEKGVATLQYNVLRRHTIMKRLCIVAKKRTINGNTLIVSRNYNLAVTNR